MTILPKKKQQTSGHQQQQQQQQQDGRQHAAGANVRNMDEAAGTSTSSPFQGAPASVAGGGSSTAAVTNAVASSAISSFLPTTGTSAAITSLPSPHHGGDVASGTSLSGIVGSSANSSSNASGIRRQSTISHFGSHDPTETDGSSSSFGPHRKRAAIGPAASTGAIGIASPRTSQSERSSPYRTTRRSNRGGQVTVATSSSAPTTAALAAIGLGAYGNATSVPVGASAGPGGPHSVRSNLPSPETRDNEGGYNSEDEYERFYFGENAAAVPEEIECKFEDKLLSSKGLRIKKMKEDGACLFRAVADQVYGDEEMHAVVRNLCMDYVAKNSDYFNQFVTEDFASYVERKRQDTTHGNHVEMQAMAELYNRPIQVYQYSCEPINTFHSPHETDSPAIRVSYHRNVHYNSVVDPHAATIGVGLGLPQFYPGLAEKNLMRDAVCASEQHEIEEAMLEDKLRATDWEATDEQLQEQVARESYLQWLRDQEKQMKENVAVSAAAAPSYEQVIIQRLLQTRDSGVSTTTTNPVCAGTVPMDSGRPSCSKASNVQHDSGDTGSASLRGASAYYGSNSWDGDDDEDLFKQVLALSQQEYFDSLKSQCQEADGKKASPSRSPS